MQFFFLLRKRLSASDCLKHIWLTSTVRSSAHDTIHSNEHNFMSLLSGAYVVCIMLLYRQGTLLQRSAQLV